MRDDVIMFFGMMMVFISFAYLLGKVVMSG